MEAVSDMLGHDSIRQTQHYARVKEKMISEEMHKVRGKFSDNQLKLTIQRAVV